jgi:hypothetical protein
MPKGGKRPGAGNPGYGKQIAVREGVERLTPRWFELIEAMLNSPYPEDRSPELVRLIHEDRKFALGELAKLMGKLIPVELTGKGGKDLFPTPLLASLKDVHNNDGHAEDSAADKENKSGAGRDVGQQDGVGALIPD